jgi:hypothetical protein
MSPDRIGFKRVGLHYIDFSESSIAGKALASSGGLKIAQIIPAATNFG